VEELGPESATFSGQEEGRVTKTLMQALNLRLTVIL
jgi:hypothetical protein